MEAPCTPALAVEPWRAGVNILCTAVKDNNEMHCVGERFLSGHWEAVISASPKAERRWLMILDHCCNHLKDDLNSGGLFVLCWLEKCPETTCLPADLGDHASRRKGVRYTQSLEEHLQ